MKVEARNYFGFDHDAVNKKMGGNPEFINTIAISTKSGNGENGSEYFHPWAVYHCSSPDISKGHKEYMLLTENCGKMYVSGRTKEELEKDRYSHGVRCKHCGNVLVSVSRHDYVTCGCEAEAMADGGKDYLRCGGDEMEVVEVDMVGLKIVEK